jgi:hypothetical protein
MKDSTARRPPEAYEIVVRGSLGNGWVHWFEKWDVASKDDGTTVLTGRVMDQAELHGLLDRIYTLNLPLISLNPVSPRESHPATTRITTLLPEEGGRK